MIRLDESYDDYSVTGDPAYPGGKAVDAEDAESENGTPYKAAWMNDVNGFRQALYVDAFGSIDTITGEPDSAAHSDTLDAVKQIIYRNAHPKADKVYVDEMFADMLALLRNEIKESAAKTLLKSRPVGSIYMSVNNESPADIFGGVWTRWGHGRVPAGVNEADADFNAAGRQGGAKTHTLTAAQMPSHAHHVLVEGTARDINNGSNSRNNERHLNKNQYWRLSAAAGGSAPHNNLQPYITCYMWRRTA